MTRIERLPSGRDFVDGDGDVRHVSDLTPEMEPITDWYTGAASHAVAGLSRVVRRGRKVSRRGGRPYPEITGRDIGRMIDDALDAEADRLGRPLTDDEMEHTAHIAERRALGLGE